jgi:hypothetical protein
VQPVDSNVQDQVDSRVSSQMANQVALLVAKPVVDERISLPTACVSLASSHLEPFCAQVCTYSALRRTVIPGTQRRAFYLCLVRVWCCSLPLGANRRAVLPQTALEFIHSAAPRTHSTAGRDGGASSGSAAVERQPPANSGGLQEPLPAATSCEATLHMNGLVARFEDALKRHEECLHRPRLARWVLAWSRAEGAPTCRAAEHALHH